MSQYFFHFPTAPHTKPQQVMLGYDLLGRSYPLIPRHSANPAIPRHLGAKKTLTSTFDAHFFHSDSHNAKPTSQKPPFETKRGTFRSKIVEIRSEVGLTDL